MNIKNAEMREVVPTQLFRTSRPGYPAKQVGELEVARWCTRAKALGIKTILCLLTDEQLHYYSGIPGGLIEYYRNQGFAVLHRPVTDHLRPPVPTEVLDQIVTDVQRTDKAVLVHCSAGIDRTGAVVRHLQWRCPELSALEQPLSAAVGDQQTTPLP